MKKVVLLAVAMLSAIAAVAQTHVVFKAEGIDSVVTPSAGFKSLKYVDDKDVLIAGHESVDLGLPSGLRWASVNLGAQKPGDFGLYFWYGDVNGQDREISDGYNYGASNKDIITYGKTQGNLTSSHIVDAKSNLTSQYDAASKYWGEEWRMPTADDFRELLDHCGWQWVVTDRVQGYKITGPNGNSIFLPAAGFRLNREMCHDGGYYYSSTVNEDTTGAHILHLYFGENGMWGNTVQLDYANRYMGCNVRPVTQHEPTADSGQDGRKIIFDAEKIGAVVIDCDAFAGLEFIDKEDTQAGGTEEFADVITMVPSRKFKMTYTTRMTADKAVKFTKILIMQPVPENNMYHNIIDFQAPDGKLTKDRDVMHLDRVANFDVATNVTEMDFKYTCTVQCNDVHVDFDKIKTIYPYDKNSELYKRYTCENGPCVQPFHPTVMHVGDSIMRVSSDIIDYARRCYEYVASTYTYMDGVSTLEAALAQGGGDCGAFSTYFVSLARYAGIPARHVATIYPMGGTHVWAEFYLEKYGWIPVDPTFKHGDPYADFFGHYNSQAVVLARDMMLDINLDTVGYINGEWVQGAYCWYWCATNGNVNFDNFQTGELIDEKSQP